MPSSLWETEQYGVYRLRVPSNPQQPDSSPKVVASIPVRCWANDRWATALTLQMLPDDRIGGLAFEMHCERGPAAGSSLVEAQALAALNVFTPPEEQYVQLRWPATAVPLRPSATGAFGGDVAGAAPQQAPAGSGVPPAGSQGRSAAVAQGSSEAGSEEGEKGPPPKDERTWLQKNWMLAMPLFMVAMNLLGNQLGGGASGARGREQARQGAAPAAGGRANTRGR
ncbi:hypothetical protein N2152v2_004319 [Parachlorella kessleri]